MDPFGVTASPFGSVPAGISAPAVLVARAIGTTPDGPTTYAVVPSGVMAIPVGDSRVGNGVPAVCVATSIGVTLFESSLVMYAVAPFGVMAMADGPSPALMGVPGVLVARAIGVTMSSPPVGANAAPESGVMATAIGSAPVGIGAPAVLVTALIGVTLLLCVLATYTVHARPADWDATGDGSTPTPEAATSSAPPSRRARCSRHRHADLPVPNTQFECADDAARP